MPLSRPLTRRDALSLLATLPVLGVLPATAQTTGQTMDIWSVQDTFDAMEQDLVRLVDLRTPEEWARTGVARGAWPINLYRDDFAQKLFAAKELAEGRIIALICATGGRSGAVMERLRAADQRGFVDVGEGMMGSRRGPGWIAAGLPVVPMDAALAALPPELV